MQFFISEITKRGHNTGSVRYMWKQKHNHSPKYFLLYSSDNGLCPQKEFPYKLVHFKSLFPNTSVCVVQYTVRTGKFCLQVQEKGSLGQFSAVLHITQLFSTVVLPKNHEVL
jgi:hypothetical protein